MFSVKQGFSYNMNRTSKMGALFEGKLLLRKKVDYLEDCLLRRINYKLLFNERTTWKSSAYRKSLLSLKTGLFQRQSGLSGRIFLKKKKL